MKPIYWLASAIVTAAVLSACAAPAPAAPVDSAAAYVSANLDTSYENALSARNQLALGTLNLADTPEAVSPEQAAALLPLWQAVRATSQSGGGSQTEVNALLTQIEAGLTEAQLTAIRAQGLTQTDLQDWATANGVTLGTGGGEPGSGQGLSPEARATRQAEQGRTPNSTGGGASTAVVDAVATYLESLGS